MGRVAKNMIGEKHNHLTVIGKHTEKYKGQAMWVCRCDCGEVVNVPGSDLRRGYRVKCKRECKEFGVAKGEASFNSAYSGYAKSARNRKITWDISKEQFREITSQDCFYCGCTPSSYYNRDDLNGRYIYNGIDRINNTIGYVRDNCVPCCWNCNRAKQILSISDFKSWIFKVYHNWAKF